MSKAAFIILAAGDTHESLGRVVNAFMGALEYIESGSDVQIIFDGAGTQATAEFDKLGCIQSERQDRSGKSAS